MIKMKTLPNKTGIKHAFKRFSAFQTLEFETLRFNNSPDFDIISVTMCVGSIGSVSLRSFDILRNLRENFKRATKGYFDLSREKP
jgi:hypothetical protein